MRAFQLAWFKSGVPHLDIPQDHAFISTLYNFAAKHRIRYILNGGNISTECIRNPMEYFYYGTDMIHIRDIISKFCDVRLNIIPLAQFLDIKSFFAISVGLRWFAHSTIDHISKMMLSKLFRMSMDGDHILKSILSHTLQDFMNPIGCQSVSALILVVFSFQA